MKKAQFTDLSDKIKDLILVDLDGFLDTRGMNVQGYDREHYSTIPQFRDLNFCTDSFSLSRSGVLRGFHGDKVTWKLIQCLFGEIQFYVIDMREDSPTYKRNYGMILNANKPQQILVPAGVVNAHLCLTPSCIFSYKLSHTYVPPEQQIRVKWNDHRFLYDMNWMIDAPILSERDSF